jgi:hypothetical protein
VMWIGEIEPLCSQIERFVHSIGRQPVRNVSGTPTS